MAKTPAQRMYKAVSIGDAREARRILDEHPEELTDYPGSTASWLHYAAGEGHNHLVDVFLKAGLDINYGQDSCFGTPLSDAILNGHIDTAKFLVSLGADPSAARMLISAINAKANSFELVKLLVEHGANVNEWWRFGDEETGPIFNALSFALAGGRNDIADYLRAHGAVMPPVEEEESSPKTANDEVVGYFTNQVGLVSPLQLIEIVPTSEVPIGIHVIPAGPDRPCVTFFTTGMSDRPMTVPPEGRDFRFAELMIQLPADWPLTRDALLKSEHGWPVRFLREIAAYPHQVQSWLGGPVTIYANGDPPQPLAPGCRFTSMLLIANYEDVGPIVLKDGRGVQIYTVVPLYDEERDLEISQGPNCSAGWTNSRLLRSLT